MSAGSVALVTPWFCPCDTDFSLQNCERMSFWYLNHKVVIICYSICKKQLHQLCRVGKMRNIYENTWHRIDFSVQMAQTSKDQQWPCETPEPHFKERSWISTSSIWNFSSRSTEQIICLLWLGCKSHEDGLLYFAHWCTCVASHFWLCNPMDCSPQAPLSMGFSRQEDWSGLPCPPPEE